MTSFDPTKSAAENEARELSAWDARLRVIAERDDALAEVQRLGALVEKLEQDETGTIDERDNNAEWADKLAAAIATHFGVDIGEHSNANSPWANALEAFANTPVLPTRPLTGRCGVCGKGVHQVVGAEGMGWSHYAMPVPFHMADGVTVNGPDEGGVPC